SVRVDGAVLLQETLDGRWIEQPRIRIDVDKERDRPRMPNAIRRCHEGHRRRDDRLAWSYPERELRQKQGGGAGANRRRVTRPDVLSELFLEAGGLGSSTQPSTPECIHDLGDFLFADVGFSKDDVVTHFCSALGEKGSVNGSF